MTGKFYRPLVAVAMLAVSVPALAEPQYSTAKMTVDYSGLNLATPSGRQALDSRINTAIRTMCGTPVFGTRDEAEALNACYDEARTAVEPQVRSVLANANMTVASRN